MLFPEFLYRLSARDEQVTWLDPFIQDTSDSQVATVVTASIQVPEARALVLTSAAGEYLTGAGEQLQSRKLVLVTPTGSEEAALAIDDELPAAGQDRALNFSGQVIVPPQWFVRARGIFIGGLAANTVSINITGVLIPVANIQRV